MRLPAGRAIARWGIVCVLAGTILFTVSAELYIRFHYAAVMPRFPEPQAGRIYRTMAAFGAAVYVNKCEIDKVNFVNYYLMGISGIFVLVLYYLKARLGWF
jgi:hypothetical protein